MAYKRKRGKSIVKTKKKKSYRFKGIDYASGLERYMAVCLDDEKIDFQYEPETFQVMEGFRFPFKCYERQSNGKGDMINRGEKKVLPIKYTPDFIGEGFIIETKGYANETFPIRWKLFKKMLVDRGYDPSDIVIYKPQKQTECAEVVRLIKQHNDRKGSNEQQERASNI